ncbi:MAG: zinc ABC transporter substrate-binding protein [Rhodospirillaceae bacterium]|nr:zinc ABC transporter substrate-binding protein [Rhodospirillaceae bacterium]
MVLLRFCAIALLFASIPALAAPKVAVSIKPLQGLAARVTAGVTAPALLVTGTASPHSYSLKPSDMRALEGADVVFWMGPAFEVFLVQPLASIRARAIPLMAVPGVMPLRGRTGGLWDSSVQQKDAAVDPHVWLDIANAQAIARAMATALSAADPADAARYGANLRALAADLDALDGELQALLAPVRDRPFIVFHDATQYFERRYGLAGVGAVTLGPERPPGARRIDALRVRIARNDIVCLFTEPQFEPKLIATLSGEGRIKTAVLDPEGAALTPGPALYFELMRGLGRSFSECLATK